MQRHGLDVTWHVNDGGGDAYGMMGGGGSGGGLRGGNSLGDFVHSEGQSVNFSLFFFQAEDGIRDAQESRGLGDVYKRQGQSSALSRVERRERSPI